MKSLLFISLFLASSCLGDFDLSSVFPEEETKRTKYIWQINVQDLLLHLVDEEDQGGVTFQTTLDQALSIQDSTGQSLVQLWGAAYIKASNNPLASLFSSNEKLAIQASFSNDKVLKMLQDKVDDTKARFIIIMKERLEAFDIKIINIASIENTDRVVVEVLGVQKRIEKKIATRGTLGFWEVYENTDLSTPLIALNELLNKEKEIQDSLSSQEDLSLEEDYGPLFNILYPNFEPSNFGSATIGYSKQSNKQAIMNLLTSPQAKKILGSKWNSIRFVWEAKGFEGTDGKTYFILYALNTKNHTTAEINQTHILTSTISPSHIGKGFAINISMTEEGAILWKKMTTDNVGRQVTIVLNNEVHSAPIINEPIPNGNLSIAGGFTDLEMAEDFQDILSFKTILPYVPTLIEQSIYSNQED